MVPLGTPLAGSGGGVLTLDANILVPCSRNKYLQLALFIWVIKIYLHHAIRQQMSWHWMVLANCRGGEGGGGEDSLVLLFRGNNNKSGYHTQHDHPICWLLLMPLLQWPSNY